jgi:apolipoprotein N-acyltransferase
VLVAAYCAIYPMLAAGLAWRLAGPAAKGDPAPRPDAAFVLVAGAAWIATEYLRGTMFTGYPWDPLATIWVAAPFVVLGAAWIGTYALSGLTVAASGLLALAPRRPVMAGIPLLLLIALAAIPHAAVKQDKAAAGLPLLVVVQPDLPEEVKPTDAYAEDNFQAIARIAGKPDPNHPRLLLWPEGAIRFPLENGYPRYFYYLYGDAGVSRIRMALLLGDRDAILTGGQASIFDRKSGDLVAATNSIFALGADTALHGRYDKAHLVPYGEYLPMRPLLEAIGLARLVPGDIDFIPGPGPRTMNVAGFGKVGMLICYEVIFSGQVVDPAHRPDFIFNPSNDAWFGTLGPPAHLAQARLRAVEEGLPIVRSTPTGISAVIQPDGAVTDSIPMGQAGRIEAPIPRPCPPTLFSRLGNWLAAIVSALMIICAVALRRRAR